MAGVNVVDLTLDVLDEKIQGCEVCNQLRKGKLLFVTKIKYPFEENYSVHQCQDCGVAYTLPRSRRTEEAYEEFRDHHGKRFFYLVEMLIGFAEKKRAQRIASQREPGRILDIGCGRGLLLYYLKRQGWKVSGTENNRETCETIEQRFSIPMNPGEAGTYYLPKASFDGVVLWHVLEHLKDPVMALAEAGRLLKRNGFLIIALPNLESVQAKFFKEHWFHLSFPYHLHHFSFSSLKTLAEGNGFQTKRTHHFFLYHNVFGWIQSFLNLIFKEQDFLFYALQRVATKKNTTYYYIKLYASLMIALFLFIPSFIISVIEAVMGRGGTCEIWLEKKNVEIE